MRGHFAGRSAGPEASGGRRDTSSRQYGKRILCDVNPSCETGPSAPSDEALLRRVQQENQRQILSQLLHDLRNPIHSIRITIELFSRLARRSGDIEKLMERAASYIGPAEAALGNLVIINDRLGTYLGSPAPPVVAPLPVQEWLAEIALLLRTSRRRLRVVCPAVEMEPGSQLMADRVRVSQALLQYCLGTESRHVTLSARAGSADLVCIEVSFGEEEDATASQADARRPAEPPQSRLTLEELHVLIENAGGTVATGAGGDVSLTFKRSQG